ncbi:hypothetical protein BDR26DRAFT_399430 [Obelidium mucronatum]|nr:hypothetical protein BDR26DRAFT_399430 [Obelidium mucronatum]
MFWIFYGCFLRGRSQLGLMTFAMFMLQQITDDFANISMPITGFYFSNCVATQKVFPLLTENFINLFKALQEIWIFNDAPIVILIDEFGLTSWDRLRNSINGLVLKNPLLQSSGKIILRHNSDRAIFESQMKLLKSEISFRKDFSVFCIECVDAPLSFHVLNHIVKFYSGHNFKYWISMSDKMDSVFDIAPTKLADVAADMLEISTSLPVVSCHQVAEKSYAYLLLNQFTGEGVLPNHFEKVLSDLSENSAFWRAHKSCL